MSRTRLSVLIAVVVLGVGVLALNVLPVEPLPRTRAKLAYDLPRVSANTQVLHPGLFLSDGQEHSAWRADCDGRDIWVELDLGELRDIEGLRMFKIDASAVSVLFEADGWWIPAPCPDLAGLTGWQEIDLSPIEVVSRRIRLILRPKNGSAFSGLGEVEVFGRGLQLDPRRLNPVALRQSGHPDTLGATSLFDGNTNTIWSAASSFGPAWLEARLNHSHFIG